MKTTILSLGLLLLTGSSFAQVVYSNQVDLAASATKIALANAAYAILPTVTEQRPIPGCSADSYPCTETVVLKSEPVIQVFVTYEEGMDSSNESNSAKFVTLNFKLSDFKVEEVALLKAAYPSYKHPFSHAGVSFAKKNLSLSVYKANKTIKIVDVENSKFCNQTDVGDIDPNCKEVIAYKNALTSVNKLTVTVK